ncbi:toll/interleukin-1 receptor domain-containing protein [Anabaena sp. AL09]|jgi:hypothetical protein|uniref:toll/interleukin-1 receptor domain-containing protein n=1 Tax=Anabaena sp. AL09 TaxID=1710891 RepID=UPI000B230B42|nr:toll/interleukin-1 receptor domain-containing protein [Anabaena sp. AL09]
MNSQLLFSDYFEIDVSVLDEYGALNICIEADLPLFIDPFLLFASDKPKYKALHDKIIEHLVNLKKIAANNPQSDLHLFQFPEVKQNWLGLCKWGNNGKGLGPEFARNLIAAFNGFYADFGNEVITSSSHIEKLTLVGSGIGRDFISDFTTNLILEHLLEYTQKFAELHLQENRRKKFSIRCSFDSSLMIWKPKTFDLPYFYKGDNNEDYLILTPIDILTKDDAFICHRDFTSRFRQITNALENSALRDAINRYFKDRLPDKPKKAEIEQAIDATVQKYPEILDYYIHHQEKNRDKAAALSAEKVNNLRTELLLSLECRHMTTQKEVCISYARGGSSGEIVDKLYQVLKDKNIDIVRDSEELEYKDSLKNFMQRLGKGKCVVTVISDKYLKSRYCMFELTEFIENGNFKERIVPLVLEDAKIYEPLDIVEYIIFWEEKLKAAEQAMKSVQLANIAPNIREDIDLYSKITRTISGVIGHLRDMLIPSSDIHQNSNFEDVVNEINKILSK